MLDFVKADYLSASLFLSNFSLTENRVDAIISGSTRP